MAAMTSLLFGAIGLGSTVLGMGQADAEADYNSALAELQGEEEQKAIEEEARRLAEDQQELKASQRVAIAAGGGGSQQEQPLMLLAEQANKMQLDQSEMFLQGRKALSRGRSQSTLYQSQGRERMIAGAGQLAKQGYGLYQAGGSSFSKDGTTLPASSTSGYKYNSGLGATAMNYQRYW